MRRRRTAEALPLAVVALAASLALGTSGPACGVAPRTGAASLQTSPDRSVYRAPRPQRRPVDDETAGAPSPTLGPPGGDEAPPRPLTGAPDPHASPTPHETGASDPPRAPEDEEEEGEGGEEAGDE